MGGGGGGVRGGGQEPAWALQAAPPPPQPWAGGRGWALNAGPSLTSSPFIEEWGGLPQSPPIPGTSTPRLFLTSDQEGKADTFIRIWIP